VTLRAPPEVRLERFRKLIDRLAYESEKGGVIIVEGRRDRDSLRKMGIEGPILCTQSSRKSTVGFVEGLGQIRDVVVLTDFDRQGVYLAKRLTRVLNAQGVRTNLTLWRDLRGLTRSDVRSVEELPKFQQRLQAELHLPSREIGEQEAYEVPVLGSQKQLRKIVQRSVKV
jgi:5S rRNA maturation endonuclease (ribonuclease M5)